MSKVNRVLPLLLVLLLLPFGAEAGFKKQRLVDIRFEGLHNIQAEYLLSNIDMEVGKPFYPYRVRGLLKQLNNLGCLSSIEALAESSIQGVTLVLLVTEYPVLSHLQFVKNSRYEDQELISYLEDNLTASERLVEGGGFSEARLEQTKEQLISYYRSKGFLYVSVESEVVFDPEHSLVTVTLEVEEGSQEQVHILRINFHGLTAISRKQMLKQLETKESDFVLFTYWEDGYYDDRILASDLKRITVVLANYGYPNAVITSHSTVNNEDGELVIDIHISEGVRYEFGQISFSGNTIYEDQAIQALIDIEAGELYDKGRAEKMIQQITDLYQDNGYLYSYVEPNLILNDHKKTAKFDLQIHESGLVYLANLDFTGNQLTRDYVIRREFLLKPGDVFNRGRMQKSMRRLGNLGFFRDMQVSTERGEHEEDLNVVVDVEEKRTGEFMLGMGYSTIDGLTGNLSVAKRNLWGMGHTAKVAYIGGEVVDKVNLSYTVPWFMGYNFSLGFDFYDNVVIRKYYTDTALMFENFSDANPNAAPSDNPFYDYQQNIDVRVAYRYRERGGAIRLGRPIGEDAALSFRFRNDIGNYSREKRGVPDTSYDRTSGLYNYYPLPAGVAEGEQKTKSIRLAYSHDTRNNVFNPESGHYLVLSREYAGGSLSGDFDFHKYGLDLVQFYPSYWKFVLGMRLRYWGVDAFDDSLAPPPSELFSVGGPDTVHGYRWRQIADHKRRMLIANIEYRFPIEENINFAFFADSGNGWDSDEEIATRYMKSGVGCGLRVETPMGRLKFDYGWGLNLEEGRKDRFDFSLNSVF